MLDPQKSELIRQAETELSTLQALDKEATEKRRMITEKLVGIRNAMRELLQKIHGDDARALEDTDFDASFSKISIAIDPERYRPSRRAFSGVEPRKEGENQKGYAAKR